MNNILNDCWILFGISYGNIRRIIQSSRKVYSENNGRSLEYHYSTDQSDQTID